MFKIKPRIYVENGKMDAGKKYRGKIEKVILQYVHEMEQDLKTAKRDRVFITQTGCSTEVVKSVKDYLKNLNYFKRNNNYKCRRSYFKPLRFGNFRRSFHCRWD
ncbi:MAG: hypothetical protein ACLRR3_04135 [Eubacterium sp.]